MMGTNGIKNPHLPGTTGDEVEFVVAFDEPGLFFD